MWSRVNPKYALFCILCFSLIYSIHRGTFHKLLPLTSLRYKSIIRYTNGKGNFAVYKVRNHWEQYIWDSRLLSRKWLCKSGRNSWKIKFIQFQDIPWKNKARAPFKRHGYSLMVGRHWKVYESKYYTSNTRKRSYFDFETPRDSWKKRGEIDFFFNEHQGSLEIGERIF